MSIFQDIRYALRLLLKTRVSTTVAVLSLALGIGATTAIFSVVYAVLVDPYPYVGADRIGMPHLMNRKGDQGTVDYTMTEYLELQARAKSVESMIALNRRNVVMTEAGLPEVVIQEDFSPNAFEFFGVPPLFGRAFSPQDAGGESKVEPVAVLSYSFWQRHFSGQRDVLGQQLRLDDKFFTVVGVLPLRFTWHDADVYVPMQLRPSTEERVGLVIKVKPGIPKEQVDAEFQSFHEKFFRKSSLLLLSRTSLPHRVHVGQRRDPRQVRQHAFGAAGRRGIPAVDRLRQRRESPAGARQRAPRRNRGARRSGCRPQAGDPATPNRKRDPLRGRRRARRGPCLWRPESGGGADAANTRCRTRP